MSTPCDDTDRMASIGICAYMQASGHVDVS